MKCSLLHADWLNCLSSSNQRAANSVTVAPWHTKSVPRMLNTSKAAFLENVLAVSAWILNGSSIECHEKKRQPFSLSGVRFGSWVILGENWLRAGAVENELPTLVSFLFNKKIIRSRFLFKQ